MRNTSPKLRTRFILIALIEIVTAGGMAWLLIPILHVWTPLSILLFVISLITFSAIITLTLVQLFVVRRIRILTQTTHEIAKGALTKRTPKMTDDEIGELAQGINTMTENLLSAAETMKTMVGTIPEPLFVVNPEGVITSANLSASGMIWRTEQELVGKSVRDIFGGSLVRRMEFDESGERGGYDLGRAIREAVRTPHSTVFEEAYIKRRIYEVTITPLHDYRGNFTSSIVMMHDITHRKEIDKMKSEFVSLASHQLKTPLTSINWYLEMLIDGDAGTLNADQAEYAKEVYDASKRMARLVNDLLNVSRIDSGKLKIDPVPTQLEDFIQTIVNEIAPLATEKHCEMLFAKPEQMLPTIPVDQSLLGQVLQNLIANAIHYSPADRCHTAISLATRESDFLITIADSGIGIPEEEQKRIFEKFYRGANATKFYTDSTGLGLYIAKWIIEASGGKIWFESEADKGTKFFITIPLSGMRKREAASLISA